MCLTIPSQYSVLFITLKFLLLNRRKAHIYFCTLFQVSLGSLRNVKSLSSCYSQIPKYKADFFRRTFEGG